MHAILGWSDSCVAVYPSDMAIALSALDATVRVRKPTGTERSISFADFHRLPGDNPERDNNLEHGELILAIDLPANRFAANSYYLKVRDRASYAFALVSVAVGMEMRGNVIHKVNISLGGVAHKPWRAIAAEAILAGKPLSDATFEAAAAEALKEAKPLEHNQFKIKLGQKAIVRALQLAAKGNKA
jgi:xanthine dehydrogenase YagS FAD-binding subunit